MIKKILILAANPKATEPLRFGREVKVIQNAIKNSDQFETQIILSTEYNDIPNSLRESNLYIVHFIGHGNQNGLILEDERGSHDIISSHVLSELFELCSKKPERIKCVILNACHTASPLRPSVNILIMRLE